MSNYDYDEYVTKFSDSFKRVRIDEEYVLKIKDFAKRLSDAKAREPHHLIDYGQELKRFTTGLLGEAALEKLFGITIIDWTIGDSPDYHFPDIPGHTVGVKTVERGKFPVIFKKNKYPQIICIRSDYMENLVFVCGLADVEVLNRCQDDELILSPNLRRRGTKQDSGGFNS